MILEVCIENGTRIDELIGKKAQRIELCDNLAVGGTTVSYGVAKNVIERCHVNGIKVMSMIRPRGGDFVYDDNEISSMLYDIKILKELGTDGVVFGCLNNDNTLDEKNNIKLIEASKGLDITFHMAFDNIKEEDKLKSIDWLYNHGIKRILTHGNSTSNNIIENLSTLQKYINYSNGRVIILPGGGVNKDNYKKIAAALNVNEVHGTKIL